jgi:GST-like protein
MNLKFFSRRKQMITLYGAPGWGSAISELMLRLADMPYRVENVEGFDRPGPQRDRLQQLNPLCQVPTLVLDDGSVMTESAAVALMILDQHPYLAPQPGTPERSMFQRLLIWLVASVYPTFTYADYPQRWAPDAPQQLADNIVCYRQSQLLWLDQQLRAAPYALGSEISLLDCYIVVMEHWTPGEGWFRQHTPKFSAVAAAVRQWPELKEVLAANDLL